MAEHASDETGLLRWIHFAREQVQYRRLPSRVCRPGYPGDGTAEPSRGPRAEAAGDDGSVASPSRETEDTNDDTDADAGYEAAIEETRQSDVHVPMGK